MPEPNLATGPQPAGSDPSLAVTNYAPVMPGQSNKPARPWLPWAITAGAIFLALMAFGAGQAIQADDPSSSAAPTTTDAPAPAADPPTNTPTPTPTPLEDPFAGAYDRECSNRDKCELSCAKECKARCTDAKRCEVKVGPNSYVVCDRVDKCEVRCAGDCRVECPHGKCEIQCAHPNNKKPKRPKHAKRCGSTYVCGDDCDD